MDITQLLLLPTTVSQQVPNQQLPILHRKNGIIVPHAMEAANVSIVAEQVGTNTQKMADAAYAGVLGNVPVVMVGEVGRFNNLDSLTIKLITHAEIPDNTIGKRCCVFLPL